MSFKYRGCWGIGVENDYTPVDAANTRDAAKTMVDRWIANGNGNAKA